MRDVVVVVVVVETDDDDDDDDEQIGSASVKFLLVRANERACDFIVSLSLSLSSSLLFSSPLFEQSHRTQKAVLREEAYPSTLSYLSVYHKTHYALASRMIDSKDMPMILVCQI